MPAFLLFTLYGPLQSWGDIAVGELRGTSLAPSKSAVVGLLAACRGITRDREDEISTLANTLALAARVDRGSHRLVDYHTTQVPGSKGKGKGWYLTRAAELNGQELHTVAPSQREYLTDCLCSIAVWGAKGMTVDLEKLRESLIEPEFIPYLGRKSCPQAVPFSPVIIQANNAAEALNQYFPVRGLLPEWFLPKTGSEVAVYSDQDPLSGVVGDLQTIRRDNIQRPMARQFDVRTEIVGRLNIP